MCLLHITTDCLFWVNAAVLPPGGIKDVVVKKQRRGETITQGGVRFSSR